MYDVRVRSSSFIHMEIGVASITSKASFSVVSVGRCSERYQTRHWRLYVSDYIDLAEIVVGRALAGEVSSKSINPDSIPEPYDKIIAMLQKGEDITDITDKVGFFPVQTCMAAADSVNGLPVDYLKMLDRAAIRTDAGRLLRPMLKKLESGEDIDVGRALQALGKLEKQEQVFVPLSKVTPAEEAWIPTHWPVIDEYLGGIPDASLTVIGGPPGTGKTSFMAKMLMSMAKAGRTTAFFSLEMTLAQVMMRMLQLGKITKKEREFILASDQTFSIREIYTHASRLAANHDLAMVGIDFADRVRSEGREGVARIDEIYNTCADLAREIDTPVVVLSQLNEGYVGGRPRVNHLRGSRLIEALGALVLLLYNSSAIDVDQGEDPILRWYPDTAYIIAGKSRYGFHEGGGVGAIQVDWTGKSGFGEHGECWVPLGGS